mgnify:CR=1 FL=1
MFCTKCGSKMPDNQTFCTKCGAKLEKDFQVSERGYIDEIIRNKPLSELSGQNCVIKDLISIVLMIICLICALTKTFKIDILWASDGITIFEMIEWKRVNVCRERRPRRSLRTFNA